VADLGEDLAGDAALEQSEISLRLTRTPSRRSWACTLAVGPAGAAVDGPDLVKQPGVPPSMLARITLLGRPAVEGRDRDLQHPEDGLDPEQVTMG
jgi:hypothetical protein